VKFAVGDVRVTPFSKKDHVVYSNFTDLRKEIFPVGGRMDLIHLAKDRDTLCVASSDSYDSW
jgi:hypothetical protein